MKTETGRRLTKVDRDLSSLARNLFEAMERLDPSGEADWETLTPGQRDFYKLAVEEALEHSGLLGTTFFTDDDMVNRCAKAGE